MKKRGFDKILIIILIIFVLIIGLYFLLNENLVVREGDFCPQVCFSKDGSLWTEACFFVEFADTLEERSLGLMNRESLDMDKGMWFVFEEKGIYDFWMKNTSIPLDIIWIDLNEETGRGEIKFIYEDATPLNETPINSGVLANRVLEINAGSIKKYNVSEDDIVIRTMHYC